MLELLFLGSGSAFTVMNWQSNMLISDPSGDKLLLDCGGDIRFSLHDQGLSFRDIQGVFISHLHGDHVSGLEWLGFCRKFIAPDLPRPKLYIHRELVTDLWDHVLSGSMSCLETEEATLESYFDVETIDGMHFTWHTLTFELFRTVHVYNNFTIKPSFGVFIKGERDKIMISEDMHRINGAGERYYQEASLIFHDCETYPHSKSKVHIHYDELVKYPKEWKDKMWLYDYNDNTKEDAKKDGFLGFVQKGQRFQFK